MIGIRSPNFSRAVDGAPDTTKGVVLSLLLGPLSG